LCERRAGSHHFVRRGVPNGDRRGLVLRWIRNLDGGDDFGNLGHLGVRDVLHIVHVRDVLHVVRYDRPHPDDRPDIHRELEREHLDHGFERRRGAR
jgi:hypothetical protein